MKLRLAGSLAVIPIIIVATTAWHVNSQHPAGEAAGNLLDHSPASTSPDSHSRKADPPSSRSGLQRFLDGMQPRPGEDLADDGEGRFHRQLAGLKAEDLRVLVSEIQQRSDVPAARELQMKLLLAWAQLDPSAASIFAASHDAEACRVVAATWFRIQPGEALAWANSLPEGDLRGSALVSIGSETVYQDPKRAIEIAREADSGAGSDELIEQAVNAWAASNPKEALAWGRQIEDAAFQERVVAGVAVAWADQEPQAAAAMLLDSIEDGTLADNALVGIVQRLAARDIETARTWVAQFPEGRLRERAGQELDRTAERAGRVATGR